MRTISTLSLSRNDAKGSYRPGWFGGDRRQTPYQLIHSGDIMGLKLHIGGQQPHPDWKILDIEDRPEVDFVGDAADLSQFEDNSVEAIYASHVLEHVHHSLNNELLVTLSEWHRVLEPGGKLFISVPNLKTLCWLYLNPNLMAFERLHLMSIMFGGQTNEFDVHRVGFDFETLAIYLEEVGFEEYEELTEFNLFKDCSSLRIMDTLISLNMAVTKTVNEEQE